MVNFYQYYLEKIPSNNKIISKCVKKASYFKNTIKENDIFPKKKWYNKFENYTELEIISILSSFYELKIKEDFKTHFPSILKNEFKYIEERLDYYKDIELPNNLYITNQFNIQYDLIDYKNIKNNSKWRKKIFYDLYEKIIEGKKRFILNNFKP